MTWKNNLRPMDTPSQTVSCPLDLNKEPYHRPTDNDSEHDRPRPSLALKHRHDANKVLLSLDKSKLLSNIAYRGNHLDELKSCARDLNDGIRNQYAGFIHSVGRNIFPLIIATDHEVDGPSGVGTTLTLYEANGSVTKVSPASHSKYELYKTCAHTFMGLSVELGPYLANAGICCKDVDVTCNDLAKDAPYSHNISIKIHDMSWKKGLAKFVQRVRVYRNALVHATEVESTSEDDTKRVHPHYAGAPDELPPVEMREVMMSMLSSVIEFCENCLGTGMLDLSAWDQLNKENFPRIKICMKEATKAQADACVKQIVKWRDMLGVEAWRDLYVVIPTVWAVDGENPRKEMFEQLMDADRIQTHIISSEYPRDQSDARTLLGRVVGDRAIGRFVFGVDALVS